MWFRRKRVQRKSRLPTQGAAARAPASVLQVRRPGSRGPTPGAGRVSPGALRPGGPPELPSPFLLRCRPPSTARPQGVGPTTPWQRGLGWDSAIRRSVEPGGGRRARGAAGQDRLVLGCPAPPGEPARNSGEMAPEKQMGAVPPFGAGPPAAGQRWPRRGEAGGQRAGMGARADSHHGTWLGPVSHLHVTSLQSLRDPSRRWFMLRASRHSLQGLARCTVHCPQAPLLLGH